MFNKPSSMVDTLVEKLSRWAKFREENGRASDLRGYPTSRGEIGATETELERTVLPVLYLPISVSLG